MIEALLVPVILTALLLAAAWKRLPVYDLFVRGAQNGGKTAVQVLPNLAAMLCAISMMQSSGLMEALSRTLSPLAGLFHLPQEVVPLVLVRPLSGSASLAMLERLLEQCGADSRAGLIASTVMGSSETIFYTICVYMSVAENRQTGYAAPCSLLGALAGVWLAGMLF